MLEQLTCISNSKSNIEIIKKRKEKKSFLRNYCKMSPEEKYFQFWVVGESIYRGLKCGIQVRLKKGRSGRKV